MMEYFMPNWGEVLKSISGTIVENPLDTHRKKYLKLCHEYSDRNVITYYSAFLQKKGIQNTGIDDNDKNAFMQAVHKLDKTKGLDLILHTPGGDVAATESIVDYLKDIFSKDIRVIVPQIAMSAGTMIALSSKEIIMGKQSNLGPIDPHFNGISCAGVLEEFDKALLDIKDKPESVYLWQQIIGKYHPTFLGDCSKAVEWSKSMVNQWLLDNMLSGKKDKCEKAEKIVSFFSSHQETKSHSRHINITECKKIGVNVTPLEEVLKDKELGDCVDFQDCILTLHHTYMHTFSNSKAVKIIENHNGVAMIINEA